MTDAAAPPRARAARWAVTTMFVLNGLTIASLAVRIPSQKLDLHLTDGQLGLVSAVFGVAAVLAMQYAGTLAARLGSAPVVRLAAPALPVLLVAVGFAPGLATLAVALILLGTGNGLLDVTMNAHAVAVERALRRPVLSGCHAAWSIGAAVGSVAGAGAVRLGLSRPVHYLLVAAILLPAGLLAGARLLPAGVDRTAPAGSEHGDPRESRPTDLQLGAGRPTDRRPGAGRSTGRRRGRAGAGSRPGWLRGWSRRLLLLGLMGATVLTCEGAVTTWSGVYLHDELSATLTVATLGYVAFAACETTVRLVGDRLVARYRPEVLLRCGTAVAVGGLLLVLLAPWPALAVAGFAVIGVGLATGLPVLYGVVGHWGAEQSGATAMLARFSTMTYSGILLAPALIGWVAQGIGLTWTLAALIPLLLGVLVVAPAATPAVDPGLLPGRVAAQSDSDSDTGSDSEPGSDSGKLSAGPVPVAQPELAGCRSTDR